MSHTAARNILKKRTAGEFEEDVVVVGQIDSTFIARMEQIFNLYALPYSEQHPRLCFDERSCFLIGKTVEGLAMKAGQAEREGLSPQRRAPMWQRRAPPAEPPTS